MSVEAIQQRIATIQARFGVQGSDGVSFASALSQLDGTSSASLGRKLQGAAGLGGVGATGDQIVNAAKQYLGVPYEWGGEDAGGFDCSGLVQHVFGQFGIDLPRVSRDQAQAGVAVDVKDLQPGDLVFFGRPVDHVGIYAGDGKMVVAPHSGANVRIQDVDLGAVTAARRVLPTNANAAGGDWASRLPVAARPFAGAIAAAAQKAGIDPKLVASVAWTESGFNPAARSGAGAVGLMQLMPATARGLGVDPTDPAQNLAGGAGYLAAQLQRFGGDVERALAAYNAGPTAVTKAGGVPPYPETQAYVRRVMDRLASL